MASWCPKALQEGLWLEEGSCSEATKLLKDPSLKGPSPCSRGLLWEDLGVTGSGEGMALLWGPLRGSAGAPVRGPTGGGTGVPPSAACCSWRKASAKLPGPRT